MSRFASIEDLVGKIDWEGGISEALEYGVKASDMPAGYPELEEAWQAMADAWDDYGYLENKVRELLPE